MDLHSDSRGVRLPHYGGGLVGFNFHEFVLPSIYSKAGPNLVPWWKLRIYKQNAERRGGLVGLLL